MNTSKLFSRMHKKIQQKVGFDVSLAYQDFSKSSDTYEIAVQGNGKFGLFHYNLNSSFDEFVNQVVNYLSS